MCLTQCSQVSARLAFAPEGAIAERLPQPGGCCLCPKSSSMTYLKLRNHFASSYLLSTALSHPRACVCICSREAPTCWLIETTFTLISSGCASPTVLHLGECSTQLVSARCFLERRSINLLKFQPVGDA